MTNRYTLKDDYTEPYTDGSGRTRMLWKAGTAIGWDTAYTLGLVTTKTPPKAPETKTEPKKTDEK